MIEVTGSVLGYGDKVLDSGERNALDLPSGRRYLSILDVGGGCFVKKQDASFTPIRFSSSDLPERERVPVWREFWGRSFFGADIEPMRDAPFHVEVTARFLPEVGLVSAACSPSRFSCVPAMVTDDTDTIGLVVGSEDMVVRLHGREVDVEAGYAIAMATTNAATMSWHSSPRFRSILVSRAALAPLLPDLDEAVMQPLPQRSEALRYLLGYMRFLEQDGVALSPQLARSASLHLRDLFALALGPGRDAAIALCGHSLRAARLEAIKRFVTRHCGDCRLTVQIAASRFHVTPRHIQRLFETDGTTFSRFLLETRLAHAREMLADPSCNGWSISAVALQAGFGDISYFNRCFRRNFGASPTEFRGSPSQQV